MESSSSSHIVEGSATWDPRWPAADVVILPGIPGWSHSGDDDEIRHPYPTTTTDIAKTLRSQDLTVEHALSASERQEISLNTNEIWLPVLVFATQVAANTSGDLLAAAITRLFGMLPLRRPRLHVRWGQKQVDGSIRYFEAHGDADKVLEALRTDDNGSQPKANETAAAPAAIEQDPFVEVGLRKLEEGLQLVAGAVLHPESGSSLDERERKARKGLGILRSAVDWLEDTDEFDRAHQLLDKSGRQVRSTFGCLVTFDPETGYSQTCPVALAHNRVGMSVGFVVEESECSICGRDPEDCEHIAGQLYGDEICARIVTRARLLEVSIVNRPNQPDARIHSISIGRTELESALGSSFRYGMPVSCDRCLHECDGVYDSKEPP